MKKILYIVSIASAICSAVGCGLSHQMVNDQPLTSKVKNVDTTGKVIQISGMRGWYQVPDRMKVGDTVKLIKRIK